MCWRKKNTFCPFTKSTALHPNPFPGSTMKQNPLKLHLKSHTNLPRFHSVVGVAHLKTGNIHQLTKKEFFWVRGLVWGQVKTDTISVIREFRGLHQFKGKLWDKLRDYLKLQDAKTPSKR